MHNSTVPQQQQHKDNRTNKRQIDWHLPRTAAATPTPYPSPFHQTTAAQAVEAVQLNRMPNWGSQSQRIAVNNFDCFVAKLKLAWQYQAADAQQ